MTRLYIIRHAEAEGNVYRRCQGRYDSLLTQNGKKQVAELERKISGISFDAVYSSDLRRTMETAGAFVNNEIIKRENLREIKLGIWEDMPWGEVLKRYPSQYTAFSLCSDKFSLPGAETCHEAAKRVYYEISRIASAHPGGTVAVVTHGMALRLFLREITEEEDIPHMDNASITEIEWGRKPKIVVMGDSSYLKELSTFSRQNWWRAGYDYNLWFRSAEFPKDEKLVCSLKREAWITVYSKDEGFIEEDMLQEAMRHVRKNPKALRIAMLDEEPVGLLHMAPESDADKDEYHMTLIYLREAYCGKGIGLQLLGEAVSLAREAGKKALRLRVWEKNERALKFYYGNGFYLKERTGGMFGDLLIMRKELI